MVSFCRTVSCKLLLSSAVLALLALGTTLYGIRATTLVSDNFDTTTNETLPRISALQDLRDQARILTGITLTNAFNALSARHFSESAAMPRYLQQRQMLVTTLRLYTSLGPEGGAQSEQLGRAAHTLLAANDAMHQALARQDWTRVLSLRRNINRFATHFHEESSLALREERAAFRFNQNKVATNVERAHSVSIVFSALAFFTTLGLARYLVTSLSRPLDLLIQANQAMARGEWQRVELSRQDEIGALAQAFNTMSDERRHAEHSLRENEARMRSVLQGLGEGLLITDLEDRILYSNPKLQQMCGYQEEELKGRLAYEVLLPSINWSGVQKQLRDRSRGTVETYETEILRRDGIPLHVLVHDTPLYDGENNVTGTISARVDITNRKKVEDALRSSEERFRSFIDQAMDALYVTDFKGRVLDVNRRAQQELGYTREELLSLNVRDIDVLYQTGNAVKQAHQRLFEGKEKSALLHSKHRRKDGTSFPVDVHINLINWEGGRAFMAMARNMTAHRQTQQQLIESENRFRSIFEYAPVAIVLTDGTGRILSWNNGAQHIFGYEADEMVGRQARLLIPKVERTAHMKRMVRAALRSNPRLADVSVDTRGRRKNGETFPLELTLSAWRIGKQVFFAGIMRDITDRVLSEERLHTSLREKEVLLKEIYHRVKNNLQIVSSLLNLQSDATHDAKVREIFSESHNRVRSMALVHEKLYQSNDLARIHLGDYVRDLVTSLLRSYNIGERVQIVIQTTDAFLDIDQAVPCGLIVNELVTNALKYAFPDDRQGTLSVLLSTQDTVDTQHATQKILQTVETSAPPNGKQEVTLIVADDGVGMPEFNIEETESIGLQLVIGLTEQLGGTYNLERRNGTRWTIRFEG